MDWEIGHDFKRVLIVSEEGKKVGEMTLAQAIHEARATRKNVICVNSKLDIPVCKVCIFMLFLSRISVATANQIYHFSVFLLLLISFCINLLLTL